MQRLTPLSRRRFGQGLGTCLALATFTRRAAGHSGAHIVKVQVLDFAFAPERVEIRVGDAIEWANADLAPHTATAKDFDWDTGDLEMGEAARIVFETPGEFAYFCAFHPHMTGIVVVRPKPVG